MKTARTATRTIWKTVVFAGAMLAAPACSKSSNTASTTPDNSGGAEMGGDTETTTDPGMADPCAGGDPCAADPCAADPCGGEDPCAGDPCAGRPRGGDDEGGMGRGFVLS